MRRFNVSSVLTLLLLAAIALTPSTQAQTYKVLYNFTGGQDGWEPSAGLTIDQAGNLYGTAQFGGTANFGTVFKLTHKGSGWVFNPLHSFEGGQDGAYPVARVIFGPDGSLYGTTRYGGSGQCQGGQGCGTFFNLKPPATACRSALCLWRGTVLHSFSGSDGFSASSEVVFDQAGNAYGTTDQGGTDGVGVVYKLAPAGAGWMEAVIHNFTFNDGAHPFAGVIFDNLGNLYGTTYEGGDLSCGGMGFGCGVVFRLTPSGSGWTEDTLYSFQDTDDGGFPIGGLISTQAGNLYGTTPFGGSGSNGGTVFMFTPSSRTFTVLYSFQGFFGPEASLAMDAGGNLYGTTNKDGAYGYGSVFKLTPSGGGWRYTALHDFTGGSDGAYPVTNVIFDANGNLYGTAGLGGTECPVNGNGCGVVWEITP